MRPIIVLAGLFFSIQGFTQSHNASSIQNTCRAQAKEVAQSTYSNCMQSAKKDELEKIQKDYKSKMNQLKSYYEKRIKALSGNNVSSKSVAENSRSLNRTHQLPKKKTINIDMQEQQASSEASVFDQEQTQSPDTDSRNSLDQELETSQSL